MRAVPVQFANIPEFSLICLILRIILCCYDYPCRCLTASVLNPHFSKTRYHTFLGIIFLGSMSVVVDTFRIRINLPDHFPIKRFDPDPTIIFLQKLLSKSQKKF